MSIIETVLMEAEGQGQIRVNKKELEQWKAQGYSEVGVIPEPEPEAPEPELVTVTKGERTVEIPVEEVESHVAQGWEVVQ
jgi:hypothetical protein